MKQPLFIDIFFILLSAVGAMHENMQRIFKKSQTGLSSQKTS